MPSDLPKVLQAYIEKLPPLPTSVGKVLEICRQPNASPNDLNKVISLDPVLLGRVMRLINSAYYGVSSEVTSLVRAIIMLGLNTVKNMALSTAVLATVNKDKGGNALNLDGFWLHCLCVGVTAKLIAQLRKVDAKDQEAYFICGLLHDIGKVALNNRTAAEYLETFAVMDHQRISLVHAEKQRLELTHAQVGLQILQTWQLTEEIQAAVAWHHEPLAYTGPHKMPLYTVVVANYFANILEIGFSGDRFPERPPAEVYQSLGLTWAQIEALEPRVLQEIDKAKIFLKLA